MSDTANPTVQGSTVRLSNMPFEIVNLNQVIDASFYSEVELCFVGIPTTGYIVQRSPDGVNWFNYRALSNTTDDFVSSITTNGYFSVDGYAYIQVINGEGSTIWARASS